MRRYKCSACGNTYIKDEMDKDSLYDIDSFLCMSCANELAHDSRIGTKTDINVIN